MSELEEVDHSAMLNGMRKGFDEAMKFQYTRATLQEVRAEFVIGPQHVQQYGLVHGGVLCGLIEVLCSAGAAMNAMARGQKGSVGLESTTSFLRALREGTLTGTATPVVRGRQTQVWKADVKDELGRLVATGRVRLMNLEASADITPQ